MRFFRKINVNAIQFLYFCATGKWTHNHFLLCYYVPYENWKFTPHVQVSCSRFTFTSRSRINGIPVLYTLCAISRFFANNVMSVTRSRVFPCAAVDIFSTIFFKCPFLSTRGFANVRSKHIALFCALAGFWYPLSKTYPFTNFLQSIRLRFTMCN